MRILHITPELPFEPGGGGGRGREYFFCRRMVELGHDVLNISPVMPDEVDHAEILRAAGVENWTVTRPGSPLAEVRAAVRADPALLVAALDRPVRALEMGVFWTRLRGLAHRALDERRPDAIVIGHDMAADWATGLDADIPAVLTLHNLVWQWYLSRARLQSGLTAALLRLEAARFRRHLMQALPRYSAAIAVSTKEAAELRKATSLPISVIPSPTDVEGLYAGAEPQAPPKLVFTGTLSYEPNRRGIEWFANQVWPLILRRTPAATLDVVGRDPPPAVRALARRDGIEVIGPVPDMTPYFTRAHVVVVPILTGAGIRMKIVDGMAAGRAIVSTTLGWEGLPHVEPDRHLLIADTPAAFAEAVVRLLEDPVLRQQIAREARSLARAEYDWRRLGDQQEAVLRAVTEHGRNGRR